VRPQEFRRTGAFTADEVQLVLLRRMADLQAPFVERALARMGWSKAQLREANRRWNAVEFGRPGPLRHSRYTRALGPPVVDHRPAPPPVTAYFSCWPLPVWPGLWLRILVDDADVVWHAGLVRADGAASAVLQVAADVRPWECTLAECAAAFDEVAFTEVDLTGHEAITCTAAGAGGELSRWLIRSIWGLVQQVRPAPTSLGLPESPSQGPVPG
jgi:hypothetical protein